VKHFHHYVYGSHFTIRTDHGALNWLRNFKNPEGQLARWLEVYFLTNLLKEEFVQSHLYNFPLLHLFVRNAYRYYKVIVIDRLHLNV
jgi:hypothetical protein